MSDASLTRLLRPLLAAGPGSTHARPTPGYEHDLALCENPIVVPSRATVMVRVDEALAASERLDLIVMGQDPNARHPDRLHITDEEFAHLDQAREQWERAVHELLIALTAGGHPPRRWALRRWERRLTRLTLQLRGVLVSIRRNRAARTSSRGRPAAVTDPWAAAPAAGESTAIRGEPADNAPF